MIGATFRLGFDGASVRQGLSAIGGLMNNFGRQVAIGGARQVGAKMTDFLGTMITMVPNAAKETMDWAGSLVDLSNQTKASVTDLMALSEAFKMSGMESVDAGKMIGEMQKKIYAAGHGDQGAQDALGMLGLGTDSFDDLGPIERMKLIIEKMNELKESLAPGQLETISSNIFGGKIGLKTLRIFENFPQAMADAKKMLGSVGDMTKDELASLDALGDYMARFEIAKIKVMSSLLQGLFGKDMETGKALIDSLVDSIIALGPVIQNIGSYIKPIFDMINQVVLDIGRLGISGFGSEMINSMKDSFRSMGQSIGEGIMQSIKGDMTPSGLFKTMFSSNQSTGSSTNDLGKLTSETTAQTDLLERIYAKNPTALWA